MDLTPEERLMIAAQMALDMMSGEHKGNRALMIRGGEVIRDTIEEFGTEAFYEAMGRCPSIVDRR